MSPTSNSSSCSIRTWDSEEAPPLEIDHDRVKAFATRSLGLECTIIKSFTRGGFHEIFVLHFRKPDHSTANVHPALIRSNYTCIARFARQSLIDGDFKEASEVATIRYLAQRTTLPLPDILALDLDPENDIGAPCVLMERLPGQHLYKIWDTLSLEHKMAVVAQIADIIAELASVRFDEIGCLTPNGDIGPLVTFCNKASGGPFDSNLDLLKYFVDPKSAPLPGLVEVYDNVTKMLERSLKGEQHAMFGPPFVMTHADFDGQNMMFTLPEDGSPPKLTGLIDFEYAHSGPMYWLYEYPRFIQDSDFSPRYYAENAVLRPYFVSRLFQRLPTPEDRAIFIDTMNGKSYMLSRFRALFGGAWHETIQLSDGPTFLEEVAEGIYPPYFDREDYTPEYFGQDGRPVKHLEGPFAKWLSRRAPAQVTDMIRWCQDVTISFSQRFRLALAASCPRWLRLFIIGDGEATQGATKFP